jgi:nucleoside-diphosphate-sugar epimerase
MSRVLVTGAAGFIGRHLVRRLVEQGDTVRCLLQDPRRRRVFGSLPVECVAGTLGDADSLARAVRGVNVVYHLAGATLPTRLKLYQTINGLGTRNLAQVCAMQAEPPIVVYVSSLAAAGPAFTGRPLTEDCAPHPVSEYGRSKLAGERYLRDVASRVPVTVLRPPGVFGPGDHYTLRLLQMARSGIALVPGREANPLSWVYVADLVEALTVAADRGRRLAPSDHVPDDEGVYFIALDAPASIIDALRIAATVEGRSAPRVIHVPEALVRLGAQFNALLTRLTGATFWLNPDKVCEALAGAWTCDPGKARRELGFACATDLFSGLTIARRTGVGSRKTACIALV